MSERCQHRASERARWAFNRPVPLATVALTGHVAKVAVARSVGARGATSSNPGGGGAGGSTRGEGCEGWTVRAFPVIGYAHARCRLALTSRARSPHPVRANALSPDHHEAVSILLACLDDAGIWYRASGGLAGNIHGSRWPLHDIDIDVRAGEWERVLTALADYIDTPPRPYEDDEFRLILADATIQGIHVDISQLEGAFVRHLGGWHSLPDDPSRRALQAWSDFAIWTIPLEDLIAYKAMIGRVADLEELRRLR